MNLNCKYCSSVILAEDINLNNTLAKCRRCNAVFSFANQISSNNPFSPGAPVQDRPRPKVPIPNNITVDHTGSKLTLTQRWYSWKYIPMAIFCVFWNGFLLFWYGIAFAANAPLIFFLFPLIHLSVGIGLGYTALAGFINSSTVEVTHTELSVKHQPLPWFGNKTISAMEITQLFCEQKVNNTKNGQTFTYDVNLITREGKKTTLLSGLESPDVGLFIEQQIESWLRIVDKPVGGELPRY